MLNNSYDPTRGEPASSHIDVDKQYTSKPTKPMLEDPNRDHNGGAETEHGGSIEKDESWDAT